MDTYKYYPELILVTIDGPVEVPNYLDPSAPPEFLTEPPDWIDDNIIAADYDRPEEENCVILLVAPTPEIIKRLKLEKIDYRFFEKSDCPDNFGDGASGVVTILYDSIAEEFVILGSQP